MRASTRLAPLVLVLALAGCDSVLLGLGSRSVRLDEPFTLRVDQAASLVGGDVWFRFHDVPYDSRCPTDVRCAWEGDAEVVIGVSRDGRSRYRTLHTNAGYHGGPRSVDSGGYRITLLALEPLPRSHRRIRLSEYRATFRIERL